MNILNNSQITEMRNVESALEEAQKTRWEYCKRIFTPGTLIYWRSRGYLQEGIVQNVVGSSWFVRIRTLNVNTKRVVDVDLFLIDWVAMKNQAESGEFPTLQDVEAM